MSAMKDLAYDIEQLYIEGKNVGEIARELNCDRSLVYDWLSEFSVTAEDTQD